MIKMRDRDILFIVALVSNGATFGLYLLAHRLLFRYLPAGFYLRRSRQWIYKTTLFLLMVVAAAFLTTWLMTSGIAWSVLGIKGCGR